MKELLIHVGYPKTATTTFQRSVFLNLHQKECINYIGKRKDHWKGNDMHSMYDDFILGDADPSSIEFSDEKINVLSDEKLTVPEFHKQKKNQLVFDETDAVTDPFLFPEIIKSTFSDHVDNIRILMTVRNQADLIFSLYCQHYGKLFSATDELDSWEGYYRRLLSDESVNSVFFFNDLLEEYRKHVGDNSTRIILFEDLKYDKENVVSQLVHELNIDESHSDCISLDEKHNKSKKTDEQYIARDPELSLVGKAFSSAAGEKIKSTAEMVLQSVAGSAVTNRVKSLYTMIHWSKLDEPIKKPSSDQKREILNNYRENNEKLIETHELNKNKLEEYEYI